MKCTARILHLTGQADRSSLAEGSVFFVGTATTVIRYGGMTLLTDPNFLHAGDPAHVGYGLSNRRITDPAIEADALPSLDACLLSHFHGDHWDQVATERLRKDLPVLTTPEAARKLRKRGFPAAQGLRTWESAQIVRGSVTLKVTATPGRHGPPVVSRLLPPVMGSVLEWSADEDAHAFRIYVSGDTLVFPKLREIPQRFPDIDLALLHLGGTRVMGALVTMDARQGIECIRVIEPRRVIPVHYDDYPVFKSPLEDFLRAVEREGLESKVDVLRRGDAYVFDVGAEAGLVRAGHARSPVIDRATRAERPASQRAREHRSRASGRRAKNP